MAENALRKCRALDCPSGRYARFTYFLEEEKVRIRGPNNMSDTERAQVEARVIVMDGIAKSVKDMKDSLEDGGSVALTVIQEKLPDVFSGAEQLAKVEDEPSISVSVAQIGATISYLTDRNAPATLATGIAIGEWALAVPQKLWAMLKGLNR